MTTIDSNEVVKEMIPYIQETMRRYLNDPNYIVRNTDKLCTLFGKKDDVKHMIENINKKMIRIGYDNFIKLKSSEKKELTYYQLLKLVLKHEPF